jgi:hypothetical protein
MISVAKSNQICDVKIDDGDSVMAMRAGRGCVDVADES